MLDREQQKAAEERADFERFANAADLPVVPESIVSRRPPEPDILCTMADRGLVAFELVNLIPQELANPRWLGGWYDDETMRNIRKHLFGTYQTPHPMELVAHGDLDGPFPRDVWVPKFADRLRSMLADSAFQALWVFVWKSASARRPATAEIWFHAER